MADFVSVKIFGYNFDLAAGMLATPRLLKDYLLLYRDFGQWQCLREFIVSLQSADGRKVARKPERAPEKRGIWRLNVRYLLLNINSEHTMHENEQHIHHIADHFLSSLQRAQ